ncbi:RNA ligase A [uncultured Caudovirales phage]|uniref:RNA ligase A n=1 Tax=uncultured Caudovirales phage TaxID=2100421 RepID=A0A6J5KSR9_9CAUD|nr:RNA ligase A [uncultured Caudovirales phage]CAB4240731.1 RNA ligase A [uncultured Caudovirales phage]
MQPQKIIEKLDFNLISQLIKDGYIKEHVHPSGDLSIFVYTRKTEFENAWTDEILQCRGLISDKEGNIVARPFAKFFNLEHWQNKFPLEITERFDLYDFELYEKLDGSLGILYFYNDEPFIATKGSFVSEQAVKANKMLKSIYKDSIPLLDKSLTYLFEIIYPENRIVVNYGDESSLTLLAVIETISGDELPIADYAYLGFPLVKKYNELKDINTIITLNEKNKEGFIIRFIYKNLRIKFKFDEYVKLHSIVSELTKKKVWEVIKNNSSFDKFIENIPDELFNWIKKTELSLKEEYKKIEDESKLELKKILAPYRKEIANAIQNNQYSHVMFSMLDNKDYSKLIWDKLEPKHEIPFIEGYTSPNIEE